MTQSQTHAAIRSESRKPIPDRELVTIAGPTADIAGMKIGVRQAGAKTAQPIMCLHGIGSNGTGYAAQLAHLSDSYRVIAWDAPGYCESDPLPWSEPRPESYADALAGLADSMRLPSMIVVGSSFGAVIAAAFAERYPEQTRGLVLSAPAAGFVNAPAAERAQVLNKRISDIERLGPAKLAAERSKLLVASGSSPDIVEAATALVASVHPAGYIQAAHAIDTADTVAVAGRLKVPTLVLVGTEDVITPQTTCAQPIHQKLANGRLEILDGIGHLIKLEAPQRFNSALRSFIAGLP